MAHRIQEHYLPVNDNAMKLVVAVLFPGTVTIATWLLLWLRPRQRQTGSVTLKVNNLVVFIIVDLERIVLNSIYVPLKLSDWSTTIWSLIYFSFIPRITLHYFSFWWTMLRFGGPRYYYLTRMWSCRFKFKCKLPDLRRFKLLSKRMLYLG